MNGVPPALIPNHICLTGDKRSLRLDFSADGGFATTESRQGIIDVGEGGRLLSIEVAASPGREPVMIDIESPLGDVSRSAPVQLTLERGGNGVIRAIVLPRRGAGYEITYPSGNQ
jgi:hypothetical protein